MNRPNLFLIAIILAFLPALLSAQGEAAGMSANRNKHRLFLGAELNIPFKPTNENYHPGFGISQQYEFLLGDHFSVSQGLAYNYLFGKKKTELYEGIYVDMEYEYFQNLPLQAGFGFYFGQLNRTFFIMFKGGGAWYKYVNPAYPEIIINGNLVKEAVPRTEESGFYWFFTPSVGWQFKHFRISATYKTHIERDATVGMFGFSFSYNLLRL